MSVTNHRPSLTQEQAHALAAFARLDISPERLVEVSPVTDMAYSFIDRLDTLDTSETFPAAYDPRWSQK